jgi:hypothetical protein
MKRDCDIVWSTIITGRDNVIGICRKQALTIEPKYTAPDGYPGQGNNVNLTGAKPAPKSR